MCWHCVVSGCALMCDGWFRQPLTHSLGESKSEGNVFHLFPSRGVSVRFARSVSNTFSFMSMLTDPLLSFSFEFTDWGQDSPNFSGFGEAPSLADSRQDSPNLKRLEILLIRYKCYLNCEDVFSKLRRFVKLPDFQLTLECKTLQT